MAVTERVLQVVQAPEKDVQAWVERFWHATDKDFLGVPTARWQAVEMAVKLRAAGIGPRRAAELFKREPRSNSCQRYFDVARGFMEKVISHEEINEAPISACARLVRERWAKKHPERKRRVNKLERAARAYGRLQAQVEEASKLFNVKALLRKWATGRAWPTVENVKPV